MIKKENIASSEAMFLFLYIFIILDIMKRLIDYILEADNKEDDKKSLPIESKDIIFTVWESPDKKVQELKNNNAYQKIEYKLEDKKSGLSIDFLLGFKDKSWQLWVGKIGSCSYDDDPYKDLKTDNFKKAIITSLDIIEEFIEKVMEDPTDYVQFYKTI